MAIQFPHLRPSHNIIPRDKVVSCDLVGFDSSRAAQKFNLVVKYIYIIGVSNIQNMSERMKLLRRCLECREGFTSREHVELLKQKNVATLASLIVI